MYDFYSSLASKEVIFLLTSIYIIVNTIFTMKGLVLTDVKGGFIENGCC